MCRLLAWLEIVASGGRGESWWTGSQRWPTALMCVHARTCAHFVFMSLGDRQPACFQHFGKEVPTAAAASSGLIGY